MDINSQSEVEGRRGFRQVDSEWLPEARKRKYNWDRRSQVLVKEL